MRAADGLDSTWLFRFDIAAAQFPCLAKLTSNPPFPILPHRILSNPTVGTIADETLFSLAEQQQVAGFFASGGTQSPDPNSFLDSPKNRSAGFFEQPKVLPELLNFRPPFQ